MNALDVILVAAAIGAAVGGYRLGFLVRVVSWGGMLVGIALGTLLAPRVIEELRDHLGPTALLFAAVTVVTVFALAGQAVGLVVGGRLHMAIPRGPGRKLDAGVGAGAGVLGVAALTWLVAPAMAEVPDWPARQARGSTVVQALHRWLPEAPDPSQSVRRLLGERFPRVFNDLGPAPELGPPPESTGLDETTADRVASSVVLVSGEACDQVQEGTGFVVAEDLIATNAHVVAGEAQTRVVTRDGARHTGTVAAFDPDRDLALVRVPGLGLDPLPIGDAEVGARGAVFGHPGGGPLRLAPFRVGDRVTAVGNDIYDGGDVRRDVLILAAALQPGDSGSALISPEGEVVGVAFAIAPDRPGTSYALSTDELREVLATVGSEPVSAGACIA